ncbi:UvrD-helicase domain-containing protein [Garciella nitratireducens]|uniref:UvrD-helicase domain-containing protein n=1 Tax=Garciella nitratireducens TaxID=218205 RepID=UPI000B3F00AF|nr:UvrD-helicase domain-containing protein [Garciella nitratireducens]
MEFTRQQKDAILHKDGPALVLAVPGAGKTTVLISRAAYLIYERQVNPKKILSLTFSKAAAKEMKKRFQKIYRTKKFLFI